MKKNYFPMEKIALAESGKVELNDADLEALVAESAELFTGGAITNNNITCGNSSNKTCTNTFCSGSSNSIECSNWSCGGAVNPAKCYITQPA